MNEKTTEDMLGDLSKVEGLVLFWHVLAMAMQIRPATFTEGEAKLIAKQAGAEE